MLSKALTLIVLIVVSVAGYAVAALDCPTTQLLNDTYCQSLCDVAGDEMTFLEAAEADSSSGGINRKQTCICGPYDPTAAGCNQCDSCDVTLVAWTADQFVGCQSLSVTGSPLCIAYCDSIGTQAFEWNSGDGTSCKCAGVTVCGASSDASSDAGSTIIGNPVMILASVISYSVWTMFI
jgi:hypothetical protein